MNNFLRRTQVKEQEEIKKNDDEPNFESLLGNENISNQTVGEERTALDLNTDYRKEVNETE